MMPTTDPNETHDSRIKGEVFEYRVVHMVAGWKTPASRRYAVRSAALRRFHGICRWYEETDDLLYCLIETRRLLVLERWHVTKRQEGRES
jgi:hypothetical protein